MTLLTRFRRFAANRRRSRLLQPTFLVILLTVAFAKSTAESTNGNLTTLLVCEGEMANLTCPPGKHIVVHLANFGRFSLQPCNPTMNLEINTQCQNDNTMPLLSHRCDSQRECSFAATTTLFGDACPENAKYLETQYECIEDGESTTTSTTTLDPTTLRPADHHNEATPSGAPKEHCTTRFARYLLWPKTSSSHLAKLPCPAGTSGYAEWLCSSTGEWFPLSGPDLSGCVSDWSRELKTDAAQRSGDPLSQVALLRELNTSIGREQLVGGDLVNAVNVLSTAIDNYGSPSSSADGGEIMKLGVDVIGFLLTSGQKATWMDLPAGERRKQAATLLHTMHSILRLPTKNGLFVSEFDTTTVKLSSAQRPVAVDGSAESTADDIVSLPPSLLSSNYVEGALPVYGYASMERIADYLDSLNRMDTGHKIVSRVVALSLSSGEDATTPIILDEPITVFFHTAEQGVLAEPRECMWWDSTRLAWISTRRPRTQRGCWLKHHNSTHSVCECNTLSAYVVATVGNGHSWLAHYWDSTNLLVYASCLIAVILLLLVLGRLLRWRGSTESASANNPAKRMHLLNFVLCSLVSELLICAIYTGSEEWALCARLVVLLRYVALATLCWMLLAAVTLYHRTLFAHPLRSSPQRKDLIGGADQPSRELTPSTTSKVLSYGFAYGLTATLAIAAVVWDWGSTSGGECRGLLSSTFAMMTFLLPVSLLLFCVIAFTAATLCLLCRYPRMGGNIGYRHHKPSVKKLFDPFTLQSLRGELQFNLLVTILLTACSTFGILWALEAVGGVHSETVVNCAAMLFGLSNLLLATAIFCFLPGRAAECCTIGVSRWNRLLLNGAALSGDEKERNNSLNSGQCNFSTSPLGRGDATASTGTTSAASSDVSESPMLTTVDTMERSRQGVARSRVYVGHGSRINSPRYQLRSPHYCTRTGTLIATGTLPYVASGCHRQPNVGYGREAPDLRGSSEEMLLPGQRYHASQQREPPSMHYGDGNGTYDYATIPYDDYIANAEACQRHYLSHPYHHYRRQAQAEGTEGGSTCRSIRVEIPRVPHMACPPPFCPASCSTARIVPTTRDAVHAMMREHCDGSSSHLHVQPLQPSNHDYHQTAEESQGGIRTARFRSAPPEFPPPPPPEEAIAMGGNCGCDCSPVAAGEDVALMADGGTQMNPCSSSVQLRQPMQRVGSVNSGASSLGSSSRCGTLVLKMDLSRWPPVYSEIQESDAEEMQ